MVRNPRFFGVIVRRSERSKACEERLAEFKSTLDDEMRSDRQLLDMDECLVAFSAGMSMSDTSRDVERLKADGLIEGIDFCITTSRDRNLGHLPTWLVPAAEEGCVELRK